MRSPNIWHLFSKRDQFKYVVAQHCRSWARHRLERQRWSSRAGGRAPSCPLTGSTRWSGRGTSKTEQPWPRPLITCFIQKKRLIQHKSIMFTPNCFMIPYMIWSHICKATSSILNLFMTMAVAVAVALVFIGVFCSISKRWEIDCHPVCGIYHRIRPYVNSVYKSQCLCRAGSKGIQFIFLKNFGIF